MAFLSATWPVLLVRRVSSRCRIRITSRGAIVLGKMRRYAYLCTNPSPKKFKTQEV